MSKDVVNRFFQAFWRDDIEAAMDCFAEDAVWIAMDGTEYRGDEVRRFIVQQREVVHDATSKGVTVEYTDLAEVGDLVFMGAAVHNADGEEIMRLVDMYRTRDGRIVAKDAFSKD